MIRSFFVLILTSFLLSTAFAQDMKPKDPTQAAIEALEFRNVGPAFTSGRIADIAIHPDDDNVWYIAVGSGGVWKTVNAGTTWTPIFDDQPSYSIGCITLDPANPHIVWVGSGENVGGRHVGYGDGLYMSPDGGKSWKNMGLKNSEHISKIIIHPDNSKVMWVASQGPLWSSGGERGLYMTEDGGNSWNKVLGDDAWTGVTDILIDPRNPDRLYAATWQRHRTVAAYMGGGPKSGIHVSEDGGRTWTESKRGIPGGNRGKIGLAISPQNPDVIYAAIELNRTKGGVFKSSDRGASWKKMSDAVSGATGPHYYQELYADPHHEGRLYLMDNRIQVSDDHGKTFRRLSERGKHSDNHAIAWRADDPDYLLIGTDGGLYESFDLAATWRFIDNMPITQYYKVAVDDAKPFYHIFGGTQDNGSHGGPHRTDNSHGVRNADWYKTLGADGHQSATEPGNPDIIYAETQQGGLHRVDRTTGEQVYIQPQPRAGEDYERYNWDAPILVSPFSTSRLYFASQRVWRSDDRGDSWTPISDDLTRNEERLALPIMGRVQSWDSPWDVGAMSNYNTITSISESQQMEGLIYAGTDDGIIQVTENGGQTWRKVEVGSIDGLPETAFVNDIRADLFDANVVYASLDNHKYGDFKPYIIKSSDKGSNWEVITEGIDDRTLVWRTVQDHVSPDLLFAATEFGIYCTLDGGESWHQMKSGLPTISFRDITIQREANDLVAASFGRSFFVLDDYTALREMTKSALEQEGKLFSTREALWYVPRSIVSSQGNAKYVADNPDFGAVFTYHLKDGYTTLNSDRKKSEKKLNADNKDIPFPGWEALDKEGAQEKPMVWIVIRNSTGDVVNRISGPAKKGLHRIAWNLRHSSKSGISLEERGGGRFGNRGYLAVPGEYTATLIKQIDGMTTTLDGPINFRVKRLYEGALPGKSYEEIDQYRLDLEKIRGIMAATNFRLDNGLNKVSAMQKAVLRANVHDPEIETRIYEAKMQLNDIKRVLRGSEAKDEIGEKDSPTIQSRLRVAYRGTGTYGPTANHKASLEIAKSELSQVQSRLASIIDSTIPELEAVLANAGAPWIEGQVIPKNK